MTLLEIANLFDPTLHPETVGGAVLLHDEPPSSRSVPIYLLRADPPSVLDLRCDTVVRFADPGDLQRYAARQFNGQDLPSDPAWQNASEAEVLAAEDTVERSTLRART